MTTCSQLIKQLVVRASKQQVDGMVQMLQEWAREGQVRNWFLVLGTPKCCANVAVAGAEAAGSAAPSLHCR